MPGWPKSPSNIVTRRVFVQESVAVYQQSKWTIYSWWLVMGTTGGALARFMFSPAVASPWWALPVYVAVVYGFKRAMTNLAQRVFTPEFWRQVTSFSLTTFLLACLSCSVSLFTSSFWFGLLMILSVSYVIAYFHTLFRVVFVRHQIGWYFSAPLFAPVAAITGWLLLHTQALPASSTTSTAIAGGVIGFLYPLLTTVWLMLIWDAAFAQSYIATTYVNKNEEFDE